VRLLFWLSAFLIVFAYAGYPLWLFLRAKFWPRPVQKNAIFPSVTIVLAVHDEERYLEAKVQNLLGLDYQPDRLEIVVVSDGSTDRTNEILAGWKDPRCRGIVLPEHGGKARAINRGVSEARGEIVMLTDARQSIARDALKQLAENFADPSVGCVSGELIINQGGQDMDTPSAEGVGLYWRIEKKIRTWEGLAGSSVGATGAIYAARKDLIVPLPEGIILDDVFIPMNVARKGQRVVFEPKALAFDPLTPDPKLEFRRKLRTLFGNYQLLQLAPWILTKNNPLRFQFICHKLLRLFVPLALLAVLLSSLWIRQGFYGLALLAQIVFYGLAGLSLLRPKFGAISKLANVSLAFVVLNSAAFVAFLCFITGRKAAWTRT
jgi:poly-beta-1,6-N-acetyl-D-glucosamine synthase